MQTRWQFSTNSVFCGQVRRNEPRMLIRPSRMALTRPFVIADGWSWKESSGFATADEAGPMKKQVVGLLQAVQYMRGESLLSGICKWDIAYPLRHYPTACTSSSTRPQCAHYSGEAGHRLACSTSVDLMFSIPCTLLRANYDLTVLGSLSNRLQPRAASCQACTRSLCACGESPTQVLCDRVDRCT